MIRQKPMDADAFARAALRSVTRNRGIIVVPREAAALWYLFRISPTAVEAIERLVVRSAVERLIRPAATSSDAGQPA